MLYQILQLEWYSTYLNDSLITIYLVIAVTMIIFTSIVKRVKVSLHIIGVLCLLCYSGPPGRTKGCPAVCRLPSDHAY